MEKTNASPDLTSSNKSNKYDENNLLIIEYQNIKQTLKTWKDNFLIEKKREPTTDDFEDMDDELQLLILRREELKVGDLVLLYEMVASKTEDAYHWSGPYVITCVNIRAN
jgi:hypothetical protein